MRRNFTVRKSNIPAYYDRVYDFMPEQPLVSRIIDHRRKLVTINRSADPCRAEAVEIPETYTDYRC